jgi:hypothetical protein
MLSSSPSTGALLVLLDTCTVSIAAFRWENRTALLVLWFKPSWVIPQAARSIPAE